VAITAGSRDSLSLVQLKLPVGVGGGVQSWLHSLTTDPPGYLGRMGASVEQSPTEWHRIALSSFRVRGFRQPSSHGSGEFRAS
jgi:hypothetical protein